LHTYNTPLRLLFRVTRFLLVLLLNATLIPSFSNVALAAPTCTTICYVSPTGSDTNSGEDAANPLFTIATAINAVSAGGTVQLLPGQYNQSVTIDKSIVLNGSGQSADPMTSSILVGSGSGSGIRLNNGANNVTIKNLRITGFAYGVLREGAYTTSDLVVEDVTAINNTTAGFAFVQSGKVSNMRFTRVTGSGSTELPYGRGIFFQSMEKENIVIEDSTFANNRISGIDLNIGGVRGFRITGNTITASPAIGQTVDSGIAVLNAASTPSYTNIISGNSVSVIGRFGIEVKGSDGVVVSHNTVTHLLPGDPRDANNASENRDIAGIAVGDINSSGNSNNVVVEHNIISGFRQRAANTTPDPDTSTGFGISISGSSYVVANNEIDDTDVGINEQQGFSGTQADIGDAYFGRDNGTIACGALFSNTVTNTTLANQKLGTVGSGAVTNLNTNEVFCSIQQAIDSATTLNGHTLQLGYRSPFNPTQVLTQPLIIETATINKSITLRGAAGTVLQAPTTSNNQRILTVRANNVTIEDVEINVNRPNAVAGIYADNQSSAPFNDLTLNNNIIRSVGSGGSLTTPSGNTSAAGVALVGSGGTIERVTINNTDVLSDTATSSVFSRGIWLREVSATVSNSDLIATTQDLLYQFPSDSSGNPAITLSGNTFYGAGLDLTEPNGGVNITVSGNTFAPVSPLASHSLIIKHNYTANTITINNNDFIGHKLAIFSGSSRNVTIANNQFRPAEGLSNYTHIQIDTGYPTGTPMILADNSVAIYNNTFSGAAGSTGRALDFQNSKATGTATNSPATISGVGTITVGGTGANRPNVFESDLTQFVRFTDSVQQPSPMVGGTNLNPQPFGWDIEGAHNIYHLPNTAPSGVLGSDLTGAQYDEIEALINDKVDNAALGLYHLIDTTLGVSANTLTFSAYPDTVSAPQDITLTNVPSSSAPFDVTITSSQAWLSCTPNTIASLDPSTPQTVSCSADASGLTVGTYGATLTFTSSDNSVTNLPLMIQVTFFVTENATISATPTTLNFTAREGQTSATPSSAAFTVTHAGPSGTPDFTWGLNGALPSWLSCTPAGTTLSEGNDGTLTCSANPSGLTAGVYTATLSLQATASDSSAVTNSPLALTVELTVQEAAVLSATPTTLAFSSTEGDTSATPSSATITVTNAGAVGTPDFFWELIGTLPSWLACTTEISTLSPGSDGMLTCSANPSGLAVGVYTATLSLEATASDSSPVKNSPLPITITLEVKAIPDTTVFVHLPFIVNEKALPDLVGSFTLEASKNPIGAGDPVVVVVTITNQGIAEAEPFWVDFYINPSQTPTANNIWNELCTLDPCFGIAWGVAKRLAPGESITLRSDDGSFSAPHSLWPGWLPSGTHTLALYVDSYSQNPSGAMEESNKDNNLVVQTIPTVTGSNPTLVRRSSTSLPPRPALGR